MPKKYKERNLIEFQQKVPDDETYAKHLFNRRLLGKELFDCRVAGCITSETSTQDDIVHKKH